MTTTVSSLQLPCEPASVGVGRRFVDAALVEAGLLSIRDDAALITSEILTNSLVHAHSRMLLHVTCREAAVDIAVYDSSPQLPRRQPRQTSGEGGRGLQIVAKLADRSEATPVVGGKVFRFELRPRE